MPFSGSGSEKLIKPSFPGTETETETGTGSSHAESKNQETKTDHQQSESRAGKLEKIPRTHLKGL
jgi:hypothetical protein